MSGTDIGGTLYCEPDVRPAAHRHGDFPRILLGIRYEYSYLLLLYLVIFFEKIFRMLGQFFALSRRNPRILKRQLADVPDDADRAPQIKFLE